MKSDTGKKAILLFEDNPEILQILRAKIDRQLPDKFELTIFPLDQKPTIETGPFEDRLVRTLGGSAYKNVVLVVTDRDLSTQKWGGLSEAAVSRAAQELGLPVACYRQAKLVPEDRLLRMPGNGQIELPSDQNEMVRQIVILANGFVELEAILRNRVDRKAAKGGKTDINSFSNHQSPGLLLADVLKHRETASHFDTYACGDQGAIAEILSMSSSKKSSFKKSDQRALIVALGVWLVDLVMQYPGVLVNEVAAASYLDINQKHFKKEDVRAVFESAEYKDLPFADPERPMWWRHLLDNLVNDEGKTSGLELCVSKGIKRLQFCACSVDSKLHAGYYCMASGMPLSAEKSSGRVSWFPPGADLARLTKSTYRKLAPWIGS